MATEMTTVETLAYYVGLDGMTREHAVRNITPGAIADNTHRIYDWMHEMGLPAESDTREAMFSYAAEQFGVDYDVFYDAWIDSRPAVIEAKP